MSAEISFSDEIDIEPFTGPVEVNVADQFSTNKRKHLTFLEEKPHLKGIINSILFMPWVDLCFVTGGSDHAVILWNDKDGENLRKPKVLHRKLHSSAVMGVAGIQQKHIVISVGADKRIIGFDLLAGRADFKHQIESKCKSVLPNPRDFNLFMAGQQMKAKAYGAADSFKDATGVNKSCLSIHFSLSVRLPFNDGLLCDFQPL
ncbi:hypothetical protein HHK36_016871 [Tetracentron sinense]|uniref:Uncharacterized protein n=1 Tax=Tetracentron sinense TaxID=13715 RepID=A0A834Z1K0_TETSI|nr:hypothetical protein HHK36_016871 [Tetracentron sinense]